MFPQLNDGPASHLYILQPGYDSLIDHYTREAGARACGRTPFRPDREVRRDQAGSRITPCGRSSLRPPPCGAASRGDRRAESPGAPEAPSPIDHAAVGATGGPSRWTRWISRLRHESRSDRVLDGDGSLATRDGPRLDNRVPKDGVSPAEGETLRVQCERIRLRFFIDKGESDGRGQSSTQAED
jgi:hypothetical protein